MKFRIKEALYDDNRTYFSIQTKKKWYSPWKNYKDSTGRVVYHGSMEEVMKYYDSWFVYEPVISTKYHKI